jgi:hypothetical protein
MQNAPAASGKRARFLFKMSIDVKQPKPGTKQKNTVAGTKPGQPMNERQDSQSRDDIEADCQYAPDRQPVLHPFQFSLQLFFFHDLFHRHLQKRCQ